MALLPQLQPLEPSSLESTKSGTLSALSTPAKSLPWWRQGRAGKAHSDSDAEDTDAESTSVGNTDTETETGYVSEDEESIASHAEPDSDASDATSLMSVAQFNWSGVGKDKRRVPLAELPVSYFLFTIFFWWIFFIFAVE